MPNNQTDVSAASSTQKIEGSIPSGAGQSSSKPSTEELLANAKLENDRKQNVIEELKGKQEEMLSQMSDLRNLIESGQATRQQEQQYENLNNQQGDMDWQLSQLENDPKNKLGYLSIDRRIEKQVKQAEANGEHRALYKLQVGLIEDTAEELGMDSDKLTNELKSIAQRFQYDSNGQPINPYRKAQLAIREWKKSDAKKKADAEAKRKEAEASSTHETGTREARTPSGRDNRAKKYEPGNFGKEMTDLGL